MKIYDNLGYKILDVEVEDNSYRHRVIMGEHSLTLHYSLPEHVELPIGSYCEYQGEKFKLKRPENFKMKHSRLFEYTVILDAPEADAKIWKFRNPVDGRLKFPLTAKPHEHLQMFVDNMNIRDKGWTVGDCIDGVETLIAYDHDFCLDALSKMASTFKTEFEFDGKRVSLHKVEYNKSYPLPLSYGRGNGFKSGVGRSNTNDGLPVEILYVQGGSDNIDPSKYKSNVLLLPKNQTLGFDGVHFDNEPEFNKEMSRNYIVDAFGMSLRRYDKTMTTFAEDSLDCAEIYPKRVGVISEVAVVDKEKNFYDIVDNSIPKTLNFEDCLIEGETMTVVFQTGMLAGREFEVKYYHKSVKNKPARRFELVPCELDGETMPNVTFAPKQGDKYIVTKCMLPDSYICDNETKTGASWDMFRAAVKYLYDNEDVKFTFTGELDGIWSKKDWLNIGGRLKLGGYILFSDKQFQADGVSIRITGIKDYINKPYSPVIELSNTTVSGGVSSTLKELQSEEVKVEELNRKTVQFTKRRFRDAKETMAMLEKSLLDNYTNAISPIAVQTMSLLVGDESLQFRFVENDNSTTAISHAFNYDTVSKVFSTKGGIIQHLTLGIQSLSSERKVSDYKVWYISDYTSAVLDDSSNKYFLYIKAPKDSQYGDYILSEKAIKMEEVSGSYHFLVGILNSEYDGERSFATLYGYSEILPGRITTDRIVSGNGDSYFDMIANAMKLGSVLDFNSQGDGQLRLRGTLVQNEGGTESYIGCYRGVYNDTYTYYNGDEVSYLINDTTSTYRYINVVPSKGHTPTETVYWQVMAAGVKGDKGDDGTDGKYTELRFAKNGSTTTPPALNKTVLSPNGWSTIVPIVGDGEYLWVISAIKTGDGLTLVSQWSTPIRMTPYDGTDGKQGESPVCLYRGFYDANTVYYGNAQRLDCVKLKSNGRYYIARIDAGTFSNVTPPDTSKWNDFGAQFSSVATELLLAEGASIGDWFISGGKIVSTLQGKNKIELDAMSNVIKVRAAKSGGSYGAEVLKNVILTIDANSGTVETRTDNYETAFMTPRGIFANRAGTQCVSATTGFDQRAAICALGYGNLNKREWTIGQNENLIAGLYGYASNSGTAPDYGGYIFNLKAMGLTLGIKYIKLSGTYLYDSDSLVVGITNNRANVYLPASIREGQTLFFKQWGTGYMRLYTRSGQKIYDDSTENEYYDIDEGQGLIAHFVRAEINGESVQVWLVSRYKF